MNRINKYESPYQKRVDRCGLCGEITHQANYSTVTYPEEKKVYIWTCPNAPDYRVPGNWGYYEIEAPL